jgi:hypothetical protein
MEQGLLLLNIRVLNNQWLDIYSNDESMILLRASACNLPRLQPRGEAIHPKTPDNHSVLVVNNNGAELTSNAILGWHQEHGVEWHQIASGKPMQNGNAESTESISVGSLRC